MSNIVSLKKMSRKIKTADDHVRDIDAAKRRKTQERMEFLRQQMILEDYRDLRDDVCSILKNAGVSDEIIHSRFGPTPGTLENWRTGKVNAPRLGKMQAALRAVGKDLGIIDGRRVKGR